MTEYQWSNTQNASYLLTIDNGEIVLAMRKSDSETEFFELRKEEPNYSALQRCLSSMLKNEFDEFCEMVKLLEHTSETFEYARDVIDDYISDQNSKISLLQAALM